MAAGKAESEVLRWALVSPTGPTLSHHQGAIIRNRLYVHGGIDTKDSMKPLNKMYVMDIGSGLDTGLWTELRAPNSPYLSHHASLVIEDRYFMMIGGWDGRKRTTDVFAYDVQEDCWLPIETSGFPPGGGLSSHTATLLSNKDILIVGREGSARLQRRMGHSFYLRGSILNGEFKYYEHFMEPASRAGHTTHSIKNLLYIYGGRVDDVIEAHKGYKGAPLPECTMTENLQTLVRKLTPVTNPAKIPGGRRHHVSMPSSKGIFIHGGETFDGKSKYPVGEMIFVIVKPPLTWYKLGTTQEGRAGHVCVVYRGDIFIHGGEGPNNVVYGSTYKLEMTDCKFF